VSARDRIASATDSPMKARIALAAPASLPALLAALLLTCPPAGASESMPSRLYEVTIETVMPHLEEALRYATTRETRCLGPRGLFTAFPILRHESLKGCTLGQERRDADSASFVLICEGGNGTTGAARWRIDGNPLTGILDVKLGGKNMTFSQRVTAKPVGSCPPDAK